MTNLHKANLDFDIVSENDAESLSEDEILQSVEAKLDSMKGNPSIIMESIEIRESLEFNYDNVDVDDLLSSTGTITPSMAGW